MGSDELARQRASLRGRTVGAEQPGAEVHPVDEEGDPRREDVALLLAAEPARGDREALEQILRGARGIGLEACRQLAAAGHTVLLTAREESKARTAAAEIGGEVRGLALDVLDPGSIEQAVAAVREDPGGLDVLLNNAAAYADWGETASTADLEHARTVLDTNLFGPWRVTQAFLPLLRASSRPRVVFVTSGAGSHGESQFGLAAAPVAATYGISKAAANALVTKLAVELADTPILVNAVDPGLTATAPGMEAMGARPVQDGARSVLWAAHLPDDGPRGGFFRDGDPLPW